MPEKTDRRCFLARGVLGAAGIGAAYSSIEEKTLLAATQDGGPQRHRLLESFRRAAGAELLHEVERDAEHDHDDDDDEARDVPRERGNRRGGEQEDDEGIAEPGEELQHDGPLVAGSQDVRTIGVDASGSLGLVEARCIAA